MMRLTIVSILLVVVSTVVGVRAQPWTKVQVTQGGEEESMTQPAPVIDNGSAVRIVFTRGTLLHTSTTPIGFAGNALFYTDNASGEFSAPMLLDGEVGLFASLALDSSFASHILHARQSLPDPGRLRWADDVTGIWRVEDVDRTLGSSHQLYPALAIDPLGTLHVVYEEGGEIYYCRRLVGSDWSEPVMISNDPAPDASPSIAVAQDGTVHIAFTRWKSSLRRTLCYVSGKDGVVAAPVELRTTSAAVTGLDAPNSWPPFAPSIAVDIAGGCHIAFTAVFGTNPLGNSQIFHIANRSGSWSNPVPLTPLGTYNRVAIGIDAGGGLHVAAECRDLSSTDWDIAYIEQRGGVWMAPRNLTAGNNADDFIAASGGRAIAVRDSVLAIAYATSEWRDRTDSIGGALYDIGLLIRGASGGTPAPRIVIEPSKLDFGLLSIDASCDTLVVTIRNGGGKPLTVSKPTMIGPDSGQFAVEFPWDTLSLGVGEEREIQVIFCIPSPRDTGCVTASIRLSTNTGVRTIDLRACLGAPLIELDLTDLDFGRMLVGSCSDRSVTIVNRGLFPLQIDARKIVGEGFSVVSPRPAELTVDPGGSAMIIIRFCAPGVGLYSGADSIVANAFNLSPVVRLRGEGRTTVGLRRIWLDTASAHVGERVELLLKIAPPFESYEQVTSVRVRLLVDSTALYLHRPASGSGLNRTYIDDGSILVELARTAPFDVGDSILARLPFEGLSAGKPENPVRLDSVAVVGGDWSFVGTDGLIRLSGCDINRGVGFGRAVALTSVVPNPVGADVVIAFDAPPQATLQLNISDMTGRRVFSRMLPASGAGQTLRIDVAGLAPGLYLLELRDRGERSVAPMMIAR